VALTTAFHKEDINHSLSQSRIYDPATSRVRFGAEYATSASNTLELQYKYAKAEFPDEFASAASVQQNFHESTTQLLLYFEPSDKTKFVANAAICNVTTRSRGSPLIPEMLACVPQLAALQKIQRSLRPGGISKVCGRGHGILRGTGDHIQSQLDSSGEAHFFRAAGVEHQDYVVGSDTLQSSLGRLDTLKNQSVTAGYAPRSWCSLNLSAGLRQRNSNYSFYAFDDRYVTGGSS